MIYFMVGLSASLLMLLYRPRVSATSPLRTLSEESESLTRRLVGDGDGTSSKFGLCASFAILFLTSATRYGIGTDYWFRHVPNFEQIRNGTSGGHEVGFILVNRVVGAFTDDAQWLIALMSFLTLALIYRFIVRMSLNPALSVFLFVFGGTYLEAFNLMQQGLAVAILLNSLELGMRKQPLRFVLVTLLAASVHSSALAWLLVWPLIRFHGNRLARFLLIAVTSITIVVVPGLLTRLASLILPEYAWYFESNYGTTRPLAVIVIFTTLIVFILGTFLVRSGSEDDLYGSALINLQGASVAIMAATLAAAYAFSRLGYYFTPVQMLLVPLLLNSIQSAGLRRLMTIALLGLYSITFYFQFVVWNAHGVMPYASVLFR